MRRRRVLFAALAVALVIGAFIVISNERYAAQDQAKTDANWSLIVPAISASDHVIGDVSAPVQVIVYADFQCGYCGDFFLNTLPRLQQQFGKKIVVAYRHLPIVAPQNAQVEAQASECVAQLGGNDAFWRFADAIFKTPDFVQGIDLSTLPERAVAAGVDRAAYQACMAAGEGKPAVARENTEGSVAGLTATPGIVLKSKYRALVVKGDYYAQLVASIQYLLDTNAQIEGTSSPVL